MIGMFDAAIDWIRSTGVTVNALSYHLHYGKGHDFDIVAYIQACRMIVEQQGGLVIRNASARELIVEGDRVCGAVICDPDGETVVRAPWTLLATGGFSANPALREEFIHPNAGKALARSNFQSTGDGMRLGLAAGAALSPFMGGFYGHVIQSPITKWGPREFRAYTQGESIRGLLINRNGERFCDESLGDHQNAQRILEQPGAVALIVIDETVRRAEAQTVLAGTTTPIDKVRIAIDEGAHVAVADSWEALFTQVKPWGFAGERALATVRAYNQNYSDGALNPPRRRDRRPYDEPPFYAIEGQAGVTATHGGLRVDTAARVLDANDAPIPGLLAADRVTGA
jgi:succinate dehydrogenase/fumarate reductase flavoprotein subunit